MQSDLLDRKLPATKSATPGKPEADRQCGVAFVWINETDDHHLFIKHVIAVAQSLHKTITLVATMEGSENVSVPVDPVEWELQKRQRHAHLDDIAKTVRSNHCGCDVLVLDNSHALKLEHTTDPQREPVLCFTRINGELPWDRHADIRRMMQSYCCSVLLVPAKVRPSTTRYQRLVVALDGSTRAERVMPTAIRMANYHGAKLIVIHVIPDQGMTETGPLEAEALELQRRLSDRNQRIARQYLTDIRTRFGADVPSMSTRLLENGDVRHELINSVETENIDMIIMASHGSTGYADVPTGSVARFVLEHSSVPLLMIGRERETDEQSDSPSSLSQANRLARATV